MPFKHSPKNAEAHLPIGVKIGIEADRLPTRGEKSHPRGSMGVFWRITQQELEESPLVWCVKGPSDENP